MNENHEALTLAQRERLTILAEECGEVVQVICKILRHGFHPVLSKTEYDNRSDLERELGDVAEATKRLAKYGDLKLSRIKDFEDKVNRTQYLHHQ